MAVTINQIVQDALGILGEVTGVGTQLYSEPRMIKDAGRAFNMLFKKHWWRHYVKNTTHILSGSTGMVTDSPFAQVVDFDDFHAVYGRENTRPLPTLPENININTITGTTPKFWTSLPASDANYGTKKIQIYPITSTGQIMVKARYHPLTAGTDWTGATSVEFDRDLLVFGTAYVALSGDDLNPQAKTDVQAMMDSRYRDIQNSLANQHMGASYDDGIPRTWFSTPY